jgi:hypothetical protein
LITAEAIALALSKHRSPQGSAHQMMDQHGSSSSSSSSSTAGAIALALAKHQGPQEKGSPDGGHVLGAYAPDDAQGSIL